MPFVLRNSAYSFPSHPFFYLLEILQIPIHSYVLLVEELLSLPSQRLHPLFFFDLSFFFYMREPEPHLVFVMKYVNIHNCRISFVFSSFPIHVTVGIILQPKENFRLKPHDLLKDIIYKYWVLNGFQYFICLFWMLLHMALMALTSMTWTIVSNLENTGRAISSHIHSYYVHSHILHVLFVTIEPNFSILSLCTVQTLE